MYTSLDPAEQYVWLTSVVVIGDYAVRVDFTDGVSLEFDLRASFVKPDGSMLGSPEEFAEVHLHAESDSLLWGNGFHVHGEQLYEGRDRRPDRA